MRFGLPSLHSQRVHGMNSDKHTTDLLQLVVRRTVGGVLYAVHDPKGTTEPQDETLNCLFLFCPQGPLNVALAGLEPPPWIRVCEWQDIRLMGAEAWTAMDKLVDLGQGLHLARTCVGGEWPLDPTDLLQPLFPRHSRDGSVIFEAFLPSVCALSLASRIHYRLPAKLAAMMVFESFAPLLYRGHRWHHAWDDSWHTVTHPTAGQCGDPVYHGVRGEYSCRFSFGSTECIGLAHLEQHGWPVDTRPVVLRQGGTVDPFFERQLSDAVQMHVLGVRPYRLPFQRTCNKKGLPSIPVHVVVGDELDTLAMEWTPEGGQRMMRLTLEHVQSMWMVRELCALPGNGALHPRRPTQVCHFIDETGKPRYTYKYLYGPSLDLPAGVHDAVLHRTREIGAARAALDPPPVRVGQQYRCTICGRDFNGPTQWDDHRFGADHLKKRAALPLG